MGGCGGSGVGGRGGVGGVCGGVWVGGVMNQFII